MKYPHVYTSGNLLLNRKYRNEGWAFYALSQTHYGFLTETEQEQQARRVRAWLAQLGNRGQFLLVPVPTDPRQGLDAGMTHPALSAAREEALEAMIQANAAMPYQYRVFLALRVTPERRWQDMPREILTTLRNPLRLAEEAMGGEPYSVATAEWRQYERQEQRLHSALARHLPGSHRATGEEMAWILARSATRGMDPGARRAAQAAIELGDRLYASPADLVGDVAHDFSEPGVVRWSAEAPDGPREGYFSFLTVTRLPDSLWFPNHTEIFFRLQQFPFALEMSMRFRPLSWRQAVRRLDRQRRTTIGQGRHSAESGEEVTMDLMEEKADAEDLAHRLSKDREPVWETEIAICVWAQDRETLHHRREAVASDLADTYGLNVLVPHVEQAVQYHASLPGAPQDGHAYRLRCTTEVLSAFLPTATLSAGDPTGFRIGHLAGLGQSVYLDPDRGPQDPRLSKAASASDSGNLGSGKSMFNNLVAYYCVLNDDQVLIVDPKNERTHWVDPTDPRHLPELVPVTNLVTLRADGGDRGKLDPLAGMDTDPAASVATAKRILQVLGDVSDADYEAVAIGQAVDMAAASPKPSMTTAVESLAGLVDDPETPATKRDRLVELVAIFRYHSRHGQGQLLFSDGTNAAIDLSHPLTIVQIENWRLPDARDQTDRISLILMMAISDFAARFVSRPGPFKMVLFDEAWRVTQTEAGRQMVESLVRTGRSKNAAVYLVSQNVKDLLGSEILSNLGPRFVFRPGIAEEAVDACRILGIEPTPENVETILTLEAGECLMRDYEDRVAKVKIDVPQRLFDCFDTRPKDLTKGEMEVAAAAAR